MIACSLFNRFSSNVKVELLTLEGGKEPIQGYHLSIQLADNFVTPIGGIRWSPDSRSLTYIDTRDNISNIWSQPLSGSPSKQVTNFTSDRIFSYVWSRDGKQVAAARGAETSDLVLITNFR